MAKMFVVIGFHVWSVSVGNRGLAPVELGGDDGALYLYVAESIVRTGVAPDGIPFAWPVWMGWLMRQMGWSGTLPFKAVLLAASFTTAVVGVKLLRVLCADLYRRRPTAEAEVATIAAMVLFPSTLWIASYSIYRDAVLYSLAMCATYAAYRILVRKQMGYVVMLGMSMVPLLYLRWYAAVSVAGGVILWMLLNGRSSTKQWRYRSLGVVLICMGLFLAYQSGQLSLIEKGLTSRDVFEGSEGGSSLGLSYTKSSVAMWPLIYIYTLASTIVGPLPNQINSINTIIGFVLEVPILIYVIHRTYRSSVTRRPEALLLVSVALVWFLILPIYNDNVGTGLRLRVFGYQFLFILCILDVSMQREARRIAAWKSRGGAHLRPRTMSRL